MNQRAWKVALLLFGSGTCALIYQVAWLREFRLVFGASTAASAAVLAIFMGGLGAGGLLLGRRADRHPRPLRFYGQLELLIALSAAITPGLIWLIRHLYVALGGSVSLGSFGATVVRLILSALVLSIPTILMGGTLPAAARSIETEDDLARRRLAALYGANALGAVTGVLLSTFVLLEAFGTHLTLWVACLTNIAIGGLALLPDRQKAGATTAAVARHGTPSREIPKSAKSETRLPPRSQHGIPSRFVLALAAIVGFAFFLMELVWYRMLAPLLGGTTYTFGLILAVALVGIGIGGAAYAILGRNRVATLSGLATTCAVEGLFIAVPFALGDRLAVLAALLRSLGSAGFAGNVLGWTLVTCVVVLPVAIVAGIQFPMLIALLGRGAHDVGRHIGAAYAWNTAGAILGSLAGGFGLLPLLGALGTWQAAAILLAVFSVATGLASLRTEKRVVALLPALGGVVISLGLLLASTGPTGAWRYSAIGAGRAKIGSTRNQIHDWRNARNRLVHWTTEGVESSICLTNANGLALLNNGKSDGNVKLDASTVVMLGITGGILHPNPRSALVVGLGTGTTAGWLAAIPSMERVDVVELEPAVCEVARRCGPTNCNALDNPKVHLIIGDAREVLLASSRQYDLIVSQPSNPFRAGLSSLFSQEFYDAVRTRLNSGGILMQWVQAYEIDVRTLRSIYATLTSVFPTVDTWQTTPDDMLLVCSQTPIRYDVAALRQRIEAEPFKSALQNTWRAIDLEGFLARFVARTSLAVSFARSRGAQINTDDLNPLEYAFARTVGQDYAWSLNGLKNAARQRQADRPPVSGGDVDWQRVEDERICMHVAEGAMLVPDESFPADQRRRAQAQLNFMKGNLSQVLDNWQKQPRPPVSPTELAVVAYALADGASDDCLPYIEQLRRYQPGEADAIFAHLLIKKGDLAGGTQALLAFFERCRFDPWPWTSVTSLAMKDAANLAAQAREFADPLLQALRQPFVVYILNEERIYNMVSVASRISLNASIEAMGAYEPYVPWTGEILARRLEWYRNGNDSRADAARLDFEEFLKYEPAPLFDMDATAAE